MTFDTRELRHDIRENLRRSRKAQVEFLAELVKIPSDNPPGDCRAHAERTRLLLQTLNFKVGAHAVPADRVRAADMKSILNLVVRETFGQMRGGPVIALNAHGDVVPPGLGWSTDPYGARIRNGFMYGRGVAVSKSDFATYAFALLALKVAAPPNRYGLRGSVELHFTYDEESGGELGPKWLLEEGISRPDFAICAGFTHGITIAHNGCLHLEVEVIGKSGHAAKPATGIDALEAANGIMTGLYALRKTWRSRRSSTRGIDSPTLVIGVVAGGINTNVVPDNVKFRIDRRIIPEESPRAAEREIIAYIGKLAAKWPGIKVRTRRVLLAKPFTPVRGQEKLVALLQQNAREVIRDRLRTHGVPLYTDARHYSAAGIPTVLYGAGPRSLEEANGHRADEKLNLHDLYAATEVVALSLADLLRSEA
ncbi:MAG: M20/M25/M40 family metallo-hydrolase [Betaproteobacteria bacterium]|nr:M20/M25/M40 family metallo-hydrolase [Betaproteobacteria bacterium]